MKNKLVGTGNSGDVKSGLISKTKLPKLDDSRLDYHRENLKRHTMNVNRLNAKAAVSPKFSKPNRPAPALGGGFKSQTKKF